MKKNFVRILCAAGVLVLLFDSQAKSQTTAAPNRVSIAPRLTNVRAVTPTNGNFIAPVWSPDGRQLLVTGEGYKGLYLVRVDGTPDVRKLNDESGAGYTAAWGRDGTEVFYRERRSAEDKITSRSEVRSINIVSGAVTDHPQIDPGAIGSFVMAQEDSDPIVYVDLETLRIHGITADNRRRWLVTKGDGPFYKPLLSPDKTKVLVHKEAFMYVYAVNGSGPIASLGCGLGCSWSPNSRLILFFIDEGDGHQITGSELFICSADGLNTWQLTFTTEMHEMWPAWSPDGKHIAFSDHKSGRIFVADLILE